MGNAACELAYGLHARCVLQGAILLSQLHLCPSAFRAINGCSAIAQEAAAIVEARLGADGKGQCGAVAQFEVDDLVLDRLLSVHPFDKFAPAEARTAGYEASRRYAAHIGALQAKQTGPRPGEGDHAQFGVELEQQIAGDAVEFAHAQFVLGSMQPRTCKLPIGVAAELFEHKPEKRQHREACAEFDERTACPGGRIDCCA